MENSEYNQRKALISSKIAALLERNDCVIVPGFGGFVGSYAPAKSHPVTHVFTPPSKHVLFNAQLKTDDGLLLREIMRDRDLEFSDARNWLAQFSDLMVDRIMAGERTEMHRVGTFTVDPERNIQFRQSEHMNFLASAYGLPSIQASPILKSTGYAPRVVSLPKIGQAQESRSKKPIRKIVALAAAACFVGFGLFFLPKIHQSKTVEFSVLSSFHDENTAITPVRNNLSGKVRKSILPNQELPSFTAESARIFIVAGSYTTQENADGIIAYLNEKGFEAFVLDKTPGGLFRVVYGSYPTISAATDELASIRKGLNEEAWLLVR